MPITTYTPAAANALEDTYSARAFDDPKVYNAHDNKRVDAKHFLKPIQDEVMGLLAGRVSSMTYRQTWTCLAGLNVGDPVYVSANDTVTLADATDTTKSKVIGFVRYKPTTTTCYIEHFRYVSGLSGGTAGAAVYLTDAGGFSASAGTVEKVVGQWITTTEALLNASQSSAFAVALSGGTASFVPKWTSASAQSISAYGDDGTYGTFMALGSSTFNDANTRLKWRGTTVPASYTNAADTSGVDVWFRAQTGGAHTVNNPNGANINFMPGAAGGGSGVDGSVRVYQPNGTEYCKITVDATKTYFQMSGSEMRLGTTSTDIFGMTTSVWKHFSSSGAISIGQTTRAFGVIYGRGFTADSGQPVNILEPGSSSVSDANTILRANSSAPSAYTNASNTHGKHCIFRAQSGGTHTSANPNGGDFQFILSAKGSGGGGADGLFRIKDSSVTYTANFAYSPGGDFYIETDAQDFFINATASVTFGTGTAKVMAQAALATSATAGFLYIPSCAGKPTGTPDGYTGTVPLHADTTNHVVWGYLNSQWAQIGGKGAILPAHEIVTSYIPNVSSTQLLTGDTAYWRYIGYTLKPITVTYIKVNLSTVGAGAQTAEVALASSTTAPNGGNLTLTKIAATGSLDDLTAGTGSKGNSSSLAQAVAAGVHLWAGIRTDMATTEPTLTGVGRSHGIGVHLSTATAGALTGAGPWTGSIITHAIPEVPDLVLIYS